MGQRKLFACSEKQPAMESVWPPCEAHDAAKQSNWKSACVGDVIAAAIDSHRRSDGNFTISGPELHVSPRQAMSLTLAVNELATNALKYGALSSAHGGVDISWSASASGAPTFSFLWREHGGPRIVQPTRQGFGTRVIKHLMAADFGDTVRLSYEPDGVSCELTSPLENLPA